MQNTTTENAAPTLNPIWIQRFKQTPVYLWTLIKHWFVTCRSVLLPSLALGFLARVGNAGWQKLVDDTIGEKFLTNSSLLVVSYALLAMIVVVPLVGVLRMKCVDEGPAEWVARWFVFEPLLLATNWMLITFTSAILFDTARGLMTWVYAGHAASVIIFVAAIYGVTALGARYACFSVWTDGSLAKWSDRVLLGGMYLAVSALIIAGFWCQYFSTAACTVCDSLNWFHQNPEIFSFLGIAVLTASLGYITFRRSKRIPGK
jgi:hypothetical protein